MNKRLRIITIILLAICLVFSLSACGIATSVIQVGKTVFDVYVGQSVDMEKHITDYSTKMNIAIEVESNSHQSGDSATQVVKIEGNTIIAQSIGVATIRLTSKGKFVKNIQVNVHAGGEIVSVLSDLAKLKINTTTLIAVTTIPEQEDMSLLQIQDESGLLFIDGQTIIPKGVGEGTLTLSFGESSVAKPYEASYRVSFNSMQTLSILSAECGTSKSTYTETELLSYSYLFESHRFDSNDALSFAANKNLTLEYSTVTDLDMSMLDDFSVLEKLSLTNVNIVNATTMAPILELNISGSVSGEQTINIPTLIRLDINIVPKPAVDDGVEDIPNQVADGKRAQEDNDNVEITDRLTIGHNYSLANLIVIINEGAAVELIGYDFMAFNNYSISGGGLIVVNDCKNIVRADLTQCTNLELKKISNIEQIDFNVFKGSLYLNECSFRYASFSNKNFTRLGVVNCRGVGSLILSGMTNLLSLTLDNSTIAQLDIMNCGAVKETSAKKTLTELVTIPSTDVVDSTALQYMVNVLASQGAKVVINGKTDYEITPGIFYIAGWKGDINLQDDDIFVKIIVDNRTGDSTAEASLNVNAAVETIEFVDGIRYSNKTMIMTQSSTKPLQLLLSNNVLQGRQEFVTIGEGITRDLDIGFSGKCQINGYNGSDGHNGYSYRRDDYSKNSRSGESGKDGQDGHTAIKASNIKIKTTGASQSSLAIVGGRGGNGGSGGNGQGSNDDGHAQAGHGGFGGNGGSGAQALECGTLTIGTVIGESTITIAGGIGGRGGDGGHGGHGYKDNYRDHGGRGGDGGYGGSSGGGMTVGSILFQVANTKAVFTVKSGSAGDGARGGDGGDAYDDWWNPDGKRGNGGKGRNGGTVRFAIQFTGAKSIINQEYLTTSFTQSDIASGGRGGSCGGGNGTGGSDGSAGFNGSQLALIVTK